jgi:hypothetical protein
LDILKEKPDSHHHLSEYTTIYEKGVESAVQLLKHLSEHICLYNLEVECFKMINELIKVSFASKPLSSNLLVQHTLKLNFNHQVLLLATNLIRSLNSTHSKKLLEGLLFMYLNEKQTQLHE